jgi:NAD(P)-dependent dehydrogenase (short-subunit alcohol dehydrogenase family)
VNPVDRGIVDTPMQQEAPKDFLKTLKPLGGISEVADIVDAVVYLTEAKQVTGEVLHVDGGAHDWAMVSHKNFPSAGAEE